MPELVIRNVLRFAFLMFFQLVIIDNVDISNIVVPYVFIIFLVMLPTSLGRIPMLLVCFSAGAIADVCSNLMGFHACAATAVGFVRVIFADRILTRGSQNSVICPNYISSSLYPFSIFSLILISVYYVVFAIVEEFSLHGFWLTLLSILLSIIATYILLMLYQLLFVKKQRN